jgi:glycosyltransferase involved in cell wall biosynthesis
MPKVSIIIPTYNCAEYITEAVESALNQTFRDFEVIVVDDGSTDNTKLVLDKFIKKISYIYQENQGVAVARNNGIVRSTGDYISFLDSDNKWKLNLLAESVPVLETENAVGLVHSGKIRITEDGKIIEGVRRNHNVKYLSGYIYHNLLLRKAHINLSSAVMRKNCIDDVGLFDVNLSKIGCEDRDLFIRIARKYKVKYIDKPLYYGRYRSTSMSANYENMLRGRYYIVDKYCPPKRGLHFFRNRALSSIHLQKADSCVWKSDYEQGLEQYYKAIGLFPFNLILYVRFVKTYIKILLKFGKKLKKF